MTSFKELYSKYRGVLQESWLTNDVAAHFGPTATLDTMFKYLWTQPEAQQQLIPPAGNPKIRTKGADEAERFRNVGNRFYRERKFEKALLAYNYSILASPHPKIETRDLQEVELGEGGAKKLDKVPHTDDQSKLASSKHTDGNIDSQHQGLSLAFANRSAVLYEMCQFESSLADAERAIAFGYPQSKKHRLNERIAKCLQAMGRVDEANAILDDTLSSLDTSATDEDVAAARRSIGKLKSAPASNQSTSPPVEYERVFYTGPPHPPPVSHPNPDLPCLSDAVKIQYTPTRGRHLLAVRNIKPGEVLVLEDAIAATTKLDSTLRTHCSTCLRRCLIPLPCPTCSLVVFCSEACQREGLRDHHKAECCVLPVLVCLQLDPAAALAFRVLSSTTLPALRTTVKTIKETSASRPVMSVTRDYHTLYHLEGHITARTETQLQEVAAVACVLTRLLFENCPSFVCGDSACVTKDDVVLVGGQLMRLILGLECNIHLTKEALVGVGGVDKSRGADVGWSVYGALSFVNHSCVPNALSSSLGKVKYLYSVSIIPEGAEITDSYGERYVSHARTVRREELQRHYYFCCGCAACQADWPLFNGIPVTPSLRCPSCFQALSAGFKCGLCDLVCNSNATAAATGVQLYNAAEVQSQLRTAWKKFVESSAHVQKCGSASPGVVGCVVQVLEMLDRYTVHPNQAHVNAQEVLMTCFDLMGSVRFL